MSQSHHTSHIKEEIYIYMFINKYWACYRLRYRRPKYAWSQAHKWSATPYYLFVDHSCTVFFISLVQDAPFILANCVFFFNFVSDVHWATLNWASWSSSALRDWKFGKTWSLMLEILFQTTYIYRPICMHALHVHAFLSQLLTQELKEN